MIVTLPVTQHHKKIQSPHVLSSLVLFSIFSLPSLCSHMTVKKGQLKHIQFSQALSNIHIAIYRDFCNRMRSKISKSVKFHDC